MKILELMAKALRMENNDMKNLFEDGWQSIRMNYYPPCPQPDLVIGLNPHSDAVGLTILLQLNEMEGLQIRKDGMWIPVIPLPNAFVVNIGDILEVNHELCLKSLVMCFLLNLHTLYNQIYAWANKNCHYVFSCTVWQIVTNGIYRSIEHRATVNSLKERLSMATFYNPKVEGDLGPAPSLITPETPALFQRIGVVEYFKRLFTRKLDGKSYIDTLKIKNEE
jgi:isopenicillin N synthase-like dioxygenase